MSSSPQSRLENVPTMDRVTLRMPVEQIEAIDERVDAGEFPSRSEAIRHGVRVVLEGER